MGKAGIPRGIPERNSYLLRSQKPCRTGNVVRPGIVGLKSILGLRSRVKALETLQVLSDLGYVHYELNAKTKQLTYEITDWVVKCSGAECMWELSMPQTAMVPLSSAAVLRNGWQSSTTRLKNRMLGWICGVIRCPTIRETHFLF